MELLVDRGDVGVIVGRFQVPELHLQHSRLIQYVLERHDKTIVVLGKSALPTSVRNPLDVQARAQMIQALFPSVMILFIKDQPTDEGWSRRLDELIEDVVTPRQKVTLYGSRDSFIDHYSGRYQTLSLYPTMSGVGHPMQPISGSAIRDEVAAASTQPSADFRRGVVWAAYARFPTCFPTVDIAILDEEEENLLLGRKAGEKSWRFIGGFADPGSDSYEEDARREVREETGLELGLLTYLDSFKVDDWRYHGEQDCIKTLFFSGVARGGIPKAGDDIEEVRWCVLERVNHAHLAPGHWPLYERLRQHLATTALLEGTT